MGDTLAAQDAEIAHLRAEIKRIGDLLCIQEGDETYKILERQNAEWVRLKKMGIYLKHYELRMFYALLRRRGAMVTLDTLMNYTYAERIDPPEPATLKIYVMRLREKLAGIYKIENVWGQGYILHDA